ncbi:Protein OS-9 [Geranomyces variabilis]|nr:Protein OS-9 [Geranomyces variabilis]
MLLPAAAAQTATALPSVFAVAAVAAAALTLASNPVAASSSSSSSSSPGAAAANFNPYADLFAVPQHQLLFTKPLTTPSQIQLLNTTTQQSGGTALTIKTRHGKDFICALPEAQKKKQKAASSSHSSSSQVSTADPAQRRDLALRSAQTALSPDNYPGCLLFSQTGGYWTYEFCPYHHVRQFHAISEADAAKLTVAQRKEREAQNYYIGRRQQQAAVGESLVQPRAEDGELVVVEHENPAGRKSAYVSQKWEGGTACEVNGVVNGERSVEIQYFCNPQATHDIISQIRETATCKYLVTVHTSRLCNDPFFIPHSLHGEVDVRSIHCHPILLASTSPPSSSSSSSSSRPAVQSGVDINEELEQKMVTAARDHNLENVALSALFNWKRQRQTQLQQQQQQTRIINAAAATSPVDRKSPTLAEYKAASSSSSKDDSPDTVIAFSNALNEAVESLTSWWLADDGDGDDDNDNETGKERSEEDDERVTAALFQKKIDDIVSRLAKQIPAASGGGGGGGARRDANANANAGAGAGTTAGAGGGGGGATAKAKPVKPVIQQKIIQLKPHQKPLTTTDKQQQQQKQQQQPARANNKPKIIFADDEADANAAAGGVVVTPEYVAERVAELFGDVWGDHHQQQHTDGDRDKKKPKSDAKKENQQTQTQKKKKPAAAVVKPGVTWRMTYGGDGGGGGGGGGDGPQQQQQRQRVVVQTGFSDGRKKQPVPAAGDGQGGSEQPGKRAGEDDGRPVATSKRKQAKPAGGGGGGGGGSGAAKDGERKNVVVGRL